MKIFHMPMSRSNRIVWLCEELGLPYEVEKVDFAAIGADDFKSKYNPLGRVPAVVLDNGEVMTESGAIVSYLLETNDNKGLKPAADSTLLPQYLQWFEFGEATICPPVGTIMQHTFIRPEDKRVPEILPDAAAGCASVLSVVEDHMAGKDWVCGDTFTAADIMMIYGLGLAQMAQQWNGESHPNINAYMERAKARPAYQAMQAA